MDTSTRDLDVLFVASLDITLFAQLGLRSKTPLKGYSVFLYESAMCKTEIKQPRMPLPNASLVTKGATL